MTDQAAEAREEAAHRDDPTISPLLCLLANTIDALSARLAQAEQQIATDAHTFREWRRTIDRLEARLREYEEALRELDRYTLTPTLMNKVVDDALAGDG